MKMTYKRVVPRDLFNEAVLLKCLGKVSIAVLENKLRPAKIKEIYDGKAFDIRQDPNSGDLYCENYKLQVSQGIITFYTPLNSRDTWPLYTMDIKVLGENGEVTFEFAEYIRSIV